jgi:hypothetical protein
VLHPVLDAVRTNCHISDARHAGEYTLCTYLLKMREYYRWEKGKPFSSTLSHAEVTHWLTEREQLWKDFEDRSFVDIPLGGVLHDPFASTAINGSLAAAGYVYSAGLGHNSRPHFFFGELERTEKHRNFTLLVSGKEYARDLTAPPAMSLGTTIFVRRESLRRMIWEKIEEWRWNRPANAMKNAIVAYDFDSDPCGSLERMTSEVMDVVRLHEIGEIMVRSRLGAAWEELLTCLPRSRAEIMARAVRDHLADALSTLPGLIRKENPVALHYYIANQSGMHRELFPSLVKAYEQWISSGRLAALDSIMAQSESHWMSVANRILDIFSAHPKQCQPRIEALMADSKM